MATGIKADLLRAAEFLANEHRELAKGTFGYHADGTEFDPDEYDQFTSEITTDHGPIVSCCVVGAICAANRLKLSDTRLDWILGTLVPTDAEQALGALAIWNDQDERTKEEVVAELRAAAERQL